MNDRSDPRTPLDDDRRQSIAAGIRTLERWGREHEWSGSDQYDALNATRVPAAIVGTPLGRRILLQAVKRSPIDLRRPLGVTPGQSAVSVAWAASAYALGGFLPGAELEARLGDALERLSTLRSRAYPEPCWGYHFDFQSRVFFYPRTAPNAIATVFAGIALLDAHRRTGAAAPLELAHGVGEFFLRRVPQTNDPPGAFFGYLAGDRSPIHNSNLLICALLAELHALTGDERMARAARRGVSWSLARQRDDGAWCYGERRNLGWVDGFHTGYVLEALLRCRRAGVVDTGAALRRGLDFYRRRMFLADGTPRYFEHRTHPIDAWSVAQAIQTFALCSALDASLLDASLLGEAFAAQEFAWRRMRRRDGLFLFQRQRWWTNRALHVRGTVAPMMLALAHLLAARDRAAAPRPRDHAFVATSANSAASPAVLRSAS